MHTDKELVMYARTKFCPFVNTAKMVLTHWEVTYREILIDDDEITRQRVIEWTGFESVPTLIVANMGEDLPHEDPAYLPTGDTPRGIDRGVMITEPSAGQLEEWLAKHGFISLKSG